MTRIADMQKRAAQQARLRRARAASKRTRKRHAAPIDKSKKNADAVRIAPNGTPLMTLRGDQ